MPIEDNYEGTELKRAFCASGCARVIYLPTTAIAPATLPLSLYLHYVQWPYRAPLLIRPLGRLLRRFDPVHIDGDGSRPFVNGKSPARSPQNLIWPLVRWGQTHSGSIISQVHPFTRQQFVGKECRMFGGGSRSGRCYLPHSLLSPHGTKSSQGVRTKSE